MWQLAPVSPLWLWFVGSSSAQANKTQSSQMSRAGCRDSVEFPNETLGEIVRLCNHQTQSHEHCSFQVLISHMSGCLLKLHLDQSCCALTFILMSLHWNIKSFLSCYCNKLQQWETDHLNETEILRNIVLIADTFHVSSRSLSIPLDFYFVKSQFLMTSHDGKWHHFGGNSSSVRVWWILWCFVELFGLCWSIWSWISLIISKYQRYYFRNIFQKIYRLNNLNSLWTSC